MADNNLNVGIRITSDTTGATQAAGALERAEAATKNFGKQSSDTASIAEQLGRRGSEAKDVYEGLTTTMQGGTGAIFGLSKAWHNLSAAFAASPISATIAIVAALATGIMALTKSEEENAKAAAKSEEKTKLLAAQLEAVAEKAKELNASSLKAFQDSIQAIRSDAEQTLAVLKAVNDIVGKTDKVNTEREIARIKADPNLTETEKVRRVAIYERNAVERERGREDKLRGDTKAVRLGEYEKLEKAAMGKEEEYEQKKLLLDSTQQNTVGARAELEKLDNWVNDYWKNPRNNDKTASSDRNRKQLERVNDRRELLKAKIEQIDSPAGEARLKLQREAVGRLRAEAEAARKSADEASTKLQSDLAVMQEQENRLAELREAEDRKRDQETRGQLGDALAKDSDAGRPLPYQYRRQVIKSALGKINLNGPNTKSSIYDLYTKDRQGQVEEKAFDINTKAIQTEGRQAGETMAEAVAMALGMGLKSITPMFKETIEREVKKAMEEVKKDMSSANRSSRTLN